MVTLLCSYFFADPVHLNTDMTRKDNSSRQTWTHPVFGPTLADIPIFVLTSKRSFSAAEALPYFLQAQKRATIVGETTRGGAHPIEYVDVPELSITVKIPVTRNINPITGTDWEKVGVEPDVKVPAKDALDVACKLAREAIARKVRN